MFSLQTVFSHCNEGQHWGRCLSGFFLFFFLCMYVYVYTQLSAAKRTRTQNFARPDCGYVPTLCLAVIQEAWFSFAAHYVWMNVHEFCYILVKKKFISSPFFFRASLFIVMHFIPAFLFPKLVSCLWHESSVKGLISHWLKKALPTIFLLTSVPNYLGLFCVCSVIFTCCSSQNQGL